MNPFPKKIIIYASIVVVLVSTVFVEQKPIIKIVDFVKGYSNNQNAILSELRQEIFAPPLRSMFNGVAASLFPSKIIDLTNQERMKNGLNILEENSLLNQSAMLKVRDMFDRQYFDHISPDGNGPGYLADAVSYNYVVIGENLALGTFKNDASLVKAWMDSPGHRENILNVRYRNIGVAVGQGMFNGERVWIAVQEFGKPSSACPNTSGSERLRIDSERTSVDALNDTVIAYKKFLDNMPHTTSEENSAYNEKITEYNNTVSKYNTAAGNLRALVDTYNQHVRDFNACAAQ